MTKYLTELLQLLQHPKELQTYNSFHRNLHIVLVQNKISESLNLSFHRLADLWNDRLSGLPHLICHFIYFLDLIITSVFKINAAKWYLLLWTYRALVLSLNLFWLHRSLQYMNTITIEPLADKTKKNDACSAKSQISLGIRQVWWEFAVCSMGS